MSEASFSGGNTSTSTPSGTYPSESKSPMARSGAQPTSARDVKPPSTAITASKAPAPLRAENCSELNSEAPTRAYVVIIPPLPSRANQKAQRQNRAERKGLNADGPSVESAAAPLFLLQYHRRAGQTVAYPLRGARKVRAPQGKMPANGWAGRPDGKCHRKEDSPARNMRCEPHARHRRKAETVR